VNAARHRVLHVLKSAEREFTAPLRIVSSLASNLDPGCYEFHAALLTGGGPIAEELQQAGVRTEMIGWSGDRRDLAGAWRFFRYLQRERFCIVHQHFGGVSGRILARAAGVRGIVLHLHSRVLESGSSGTVTYNCRVADKVIATSQAVGHCARRKAEVVYPGVEPSQLSTRERCNRFTVGTAARLVPLKGIIYLIEAIARLRAEFPVRLEIAGEGPERPALEEEVARLALDEAVEFLGWRSDLEKLFSVWDVFALPSLEEGFGITALEAMAAGLPVVATDVGGLPEVVQHGITGWLVAPRRPGELAERLRDLLTNPVMRHEMGIAGRKRAELNFSADLMVRGIKDIYDRLAAHAVCRL
jgi:glycosyltransferase involved in cell wall biosynthesis